MIDEIDVATFQNFRWWSKGYQILRTRDVIRRKDLELNQCPMRATPIVRFGNSSMGSASATTSARFLTM
jgi:hypothetical protein